MGYEPLKPCPFCGGKNIAFFEHEYQGSLRMGYTVECIDCEAWFPQFNRNKAAMEWNTRNGWRETYSEGEKHDHTNE